MSQLNPGTHAFTSVDGVRQVYHVAGRGPVLIAHSGGPGIDHAYLRNPRLEEHFTMVYAEPVGTGNSGRLPGDAYHLDNYARFLGALVEHLGEQQVRLLGHSHGGFVVQKYALERPERVAGVALYDTSPVTGPDFWAAAMAGIAEYAQRHAELPDAAGVPAAFERAVTATNDDDLTAALREALPVYFADFWSRRAEFKEFQAGVRAWIVPGDPAPFDVRPHLAGLTMPTAVIVGAHDFICGPRWAAMLHEGIPGSRLTTLASSGHFGHIEEPNAFAEAVTWLLH